MHGKKRAKVPQNAANAHRNDILKLNSFNQIQQQLEHKNCISHLRAHFKGQMLLQIWSETEKPGRSRAFIHLK
jgi:hypothetical protein